MGKKKLWSAVSAMKLTETLISNYAGRLGGIVGLDRDLQLMLMNMAQQKARYWESKAGLYHALRRVVADICERYNVPKHRVPNYYALAQKVAKVYAMYPEDVADLYAAVIREQFSDLNANAVDEIIEEARMAGLSAKSLYHLTPASE